MEFCGGGGKSWLDATDGVVEVGEASERDVAFDKGAGDCPLETDAGPPPCVTDISGPAG